MNLYMQPNLQEFFLKAEKLEYQHSGKKKNISFMKSKNGTWDAGTKEGNVGQTFLWELPSLLCSRNRFSVHFYSHCIIV